MARKFPSARKAKKIIKEGVARGKALSSRQKRFFSFLAGGGRPTKLKLLNRKSSRRRRK